MSSTVINLPTTERALSEESQSTSAPTEEKNPFLVSLGERVRNLRARRGLTRKAVALAADVSERHLANLEYGIGNVSILVLLQVAGALHCSLAELIGDVTTSSPEWLLIRELLEQRDEATLRRFYDNNRRRFVTTPLYEADHILVAGRYDDGVAAAAAREKAARLAALLVEAPERFPDLARAHSDCPSAALGGSLGQIGPGDTTSEFEAALRTLAQGAISPPVETRYGVHLIRLNRHIEGRQLPFEAVRERIADYLDAHVRRQATAQYIALLIGRAEIRGIALDGASSPLVQ